MEANDNRTNGLRYSAPKMASCSAEDIRLANMVTLDDFEKYALDFLDKNARDYYRSGANSEETLRENIAAFNRFKIRPRILQDVTTRDLSTTVLGQKISFPVGVAPTAAQKMAHHDGELGTVRATSGAGTLMILSTLSSVPLEEVAKEVPNAALWFQLYVFKERQVTMKLVQRAEKAGFKALVVTVDTPFFGRRVADVHNRFSLPKHLRFANFDNVGLPATVNVDNQDSVLAEVSKLIDPSLTWQTLKWLKSITKLPIVAKGILTAEDAKLAAQNGLDAIIVSNHGGRQLDGAPATIEALPEVVNAVKGTNVEVYMDGGVRNGTDVFKALALGAKAVFIGRPNVWGLTHSGEKGSRRVLETLRKETDMAFGLSGVTKISEIMPSHVVRDSYYEKLWSPL